MTDFQTKEYRTYATKKFKGAHKEYKVYLDKEEDADVIADIEKARNKAKYIRRALKFYVKIMKTSAGA